MATIGIDLGTTNSCVAHWNPETKAVEMIPVEGSKRTMPSWVAYTGSQVVVGRAAVLYSLKEPTQVVSSVKRLMGKDYTDKKVRKDIEELQYEVKKGPRGTPAIEVKVAGGATKRVTPQEVSARILQKLKIQAEEHLGKRVSKAVITVPAYFSAKERQATLEAGQIAGLQVLRIINEPTAAALAYGLQEQAIDDELKVLVYDLGGGTFDVSLLDIDMEEGTFTVKAVGGDNHLGGEDFDRILVDHCVKEFKKKNPKAPELDCKALQRLKLHCESAKWLLSTRKNATISVNSLVEEKSFEITVTRNQFESLCKKLFDKTLKTVKNVLEDAKVRKDDIDEVVMVGGSCRIPYLRKMMERFAGRKPNSHINVDEAVAYGAAVQCASLANLIPENVIPDIVLSDVQPLSLGIEIKGGKMDIVIPRNAKVPTRITKNYTTVFDNQDTIGIKVYEGERKKTSDNIELGSFDLTNIPKLPKGEASVDVTFDIDSNSVLYVTALDKSPGSVASSKSIRIKSDSAALTPEEISHMIADAKRNEAKDASFEARISVWLKLDEVLYNAKKEAKKIANTGQRDAVIKMCNSLQEWGRKNKEVASMAMTKAKVSAALKQLSDAGIPPSPLERLGITSKLPSLTEESCVIC